LREKNLNLFDLILAQTYPWETLHEQDKILAIRILARLIAQAALPNPVRDKNHE
jgi:hypothetical protein